MTNDYETMREALMSIINLLKYDTVIDENGTIFKDCGEYIQMIVPLADTKKGYNTYDVYFDSSGHIEKVLSHRTNVGPTGQIYPKKKDC